MRYVNAIAGCALLSCSTATLSTEGANVAMSNNSPSEEGYEPAGCRSLGLLIGKGGGAFGGGWVSNDALVEYAMNDLRNKAAELGANYVRYDDAQMGVSGSSSKSGNTITTSTTTTTATVSGTAYVCTIRKSPHSAPDANTPATRAAVTSTAAASAPVASKDPSKAPRAGGGYVFGASVDETRTLCTRKHDWTPFDEKSFACSGTPKDIGAKAQSLLYFCDGGLCKIDLVVRLDAGAPATWLAEYDRLHGALDDRYGTPKSRWRTIPADCRNDDDMLNCFKRGVWLGSIWEFEDRTRVELKMSDKPGPDVAIHVIYELDQSPAL